MRRIQTFERWGSTLTSSKILVGFGNFFFEVLEFSIYRRIARPILGVSLLEGGLAMR